MALPISENEIINSFNNLLSYLPIFFSEDVVFGISDKQKYLKVQQSQSLVLNIKEGDPIPHGGAAYEAIKTGKVLIKDVPKEIYGIPFKSYSIPIKDKNGEVVGAISVGKSLEKRNEFLDLTRGVSTAIQEISDSISNLSSGVQNVVKMNSEILLGVKEANENTKDTNEIINFVQNVSTQTNLLGLNAAIEAARAGETGKGFTVVSQEIRKLSTSTSESIKKIDSVLKNVEKSIKGITDKVGESSSIFENQAEAIEKIATSIKEINNTAKMLEELTSKM